MLLLLRSIGPGVIPDPQVVYNFGAFVDRGGAYAPDNGKRLYHERTKRG